MQVVAAVEGGQHARWTARVPDRALEVDDRIEFVAGADPVVDCLANQFLIRCVIAGIGGALERGDGPAVYWQFHCHGRAQ